MTPRTPTLPATDRGRWRKLLARVHPGTGGEHHLFVWASAVRDVVCREVEPGDQSSRRREKATSLRSDEGRSAQEPARIPFSSEAAENVEAFEALTRRAVAMASDAGGVYEFVLRLLSSCRPVEAEAGPVHEQHRVGATYKQLAAIGHAVGMTKEERVKWYRIAEAVPLSQRHANHILRKLQKEAA